MSTARSLAAYRKASNDEANGNRATLAVGSKFFHGTDAEDVNEAIDEKVMSLDHGSI